MSKKKLLFIWFTFSGGGFVVGEIFVRFLWNRMYSAFIGIISVEQSVNFERLFSYHYFISFGFMILFGTLGLILELIRSDIRDKTRVN